MLSLLGKTGLSAAALVTAAVATNALANQSEATNYVVGGNAIDINVAPGTAALLNRARVDQGNTFFESQFCGATLIHPQWLVTAAHCVVARDGSAAPSGAILALLGSSDLTQPVTQPVVVAQVIVHEEYDNDITWQKDIALLRLETSAAQAPVPLDSQTQSFNDEVFVSGWGATKEGDANSSEEFPTVLQGAALRLIPGEQCGTTPGFAGQVNSTHVCASSNNSALSGSCFGDSGGPLYRLDTNNRVGSLIGIVSGGFRCGETGVYTSALAYKSWISARAGVSLPADIIPSDEGGAAASADDDDEDNILAIAGGAALVGLAAGAVAGAGGWLIPLLAGVWLLRRRTRKLRD